MNRIVIATENAGKLGAVNAALAESVNLIGSDLDITPISVESGVSDTPLSDEEGILGCTNRIEAAKLVIPDAELYIALEGILAQVGKDWFVRGWTMIEHKPSDRSVVACGAAVQVPHSITSLIRPIDQFSQTVKEVYAVTPEEGAQIRNIGANGVFSNGTYTRFNTFYDGVRICLASLYNQRNWQQDAQEHES